MAQGDNLQSRDTYINALATSLVNGQSLANVPGLLKKIIVGDMWQERVVSQTKEKVRYDRFVDFVQDYPPDGLHTKLDVLMKICQSYEDMEAVDLLSKVSAGRQGERTDLQPNIHNNIMNVQAKQGTGTAYTMRRLAKDFPSIHEKVLAKKLSPNAAAREAGFRQPKLQMPTDATAAGRYLAQRVDAEWMLACYDAFMKSLEGTGRGSLLET